jgi:hypothetical protein
VVAAVPRGRYRRCWRHRFRRWDWRRRWQRRQQREAATDAEKGAFDMMTEFLGLMLDPYVVDVLVAAVPARAACR